MRQISVEERRARLGVRHRLAPQARTGDVAGIVRSMVVLHATDPGTVFVSVAARTGDAVPGDLEKALYEQRTLLRMLGMRRTMFIVPDELAAVVQASSTDAIAVRERKLFVRHLTEAGLGGDAWLRDVQDSARKALLAMGEATAAQLAKAEPRLRLQYDPVPGKSYSRPANINSRVLGMLAMEGLIVRGRPLGSWISGQYRWSPVEAWLPGGMPEVSPEAARTELVRRWLTTFGPAPVSDLKWWTGWSMGEVKKALAGLETAEVDLTGTVGLVLADDLELEASPGPWAALLPGLDPTPMGWAERDWYLGEHREPLFDRSGNIGPTVWWNGRIVGGWAQRKDGELVVRLLEDVGADATTAIEAETTRLSRWLGEVRITPRFRTPLERELSA